MRESRTYGSGRGACHEMHVPTATGVDGPLAASRCQSAGRSRTTSKQGAIHERDATRPPPLLNPTELVRWEV